MRSRNIFVRFIGHVARKFRGFQEVWILPWWGSGWVAAIPLSVLDSMVLVAKLCSCCVAAAVRVLIPPTMKNMNGETVLITGAGQGLGRELALQFADLGATVICWDKDARRNKAVVDEIRKKDGDGPKYFGNTSVSSWFNIVVVSGALDNAQLCNDGRRGDTGGISYSASTSDNEIQLQSYGFTVDVTVREQVSSLAASIRRQIADVSMVVSNAGAVSCGPLTHLKAESIAKLIEINLLAHFWVIEAFLPSMIERRQGHIVAINSSAGLLPCPDMIPYSAAKYGLRGLMESITEELRLDSWTKNIHTTSVYLATISTGLYPPPSHRFSWWYSEISAKEAARIIIEGIRKNKKCISIPTAMKTFIDLNNLMPYRIRIILTDFFNYPHRGWFCFC